MALSTTLAHPSHLSTSNRKRRYFVLRKDIRSLCYYASREDLTLLGSIPLDIDTKLANVKPDDAGKLIILGSLLQDLIAL